MNYDFTKQDFFYMTCILRSRVVELQLTLEHEHMTTEQRRAIEEAYNNVKSLYAKCKHAEMITE